MFGDDTDSMRSGLSLETLPADGDGELPSIADRFKADAGKAAALALGDEGVVAGFVPRWPVRPPGPQINTYQLGVLCELGF